MTHAHHYRLSEPNGPISHAVCLTCGAERDYRNSDDEYATGSWRELDELGRGFVFLPRRPRTVRV